MRAALRCRRGTQPGVGADSALGASAGGISLAGGTLATTASFQSARAVTLGSGGGTISPAAATSLTLSGTISGSGALVKDGAGTLILTGTNTYNRRHHHFGWHAADRKRRHHGLDCRRRGEQCEPRLQPLGHLHLPGQHYRPWLGDLHRRNRAVRLPRGLYWPHHGGERPRGAGGRRGEFLHLHGGQRRRHRRNGTIGGLVVNGGGIAAPGNSPGTIAVNGTVAFNSGSTYRVDVTPQGQHDLITATGAVTINPGASVQVVAERGVYARRAPTPFSPPAPSSPAPSVP